MSLHIFKQLIQCLFVFCRINVDDKIIQHYIEHPIKTETGQYHSKTGYANDLWNLLDDNIAIYGDIILDYFFPITHTETNDVTCNRSGYAVYCIVTDNKKDTSLLQQWLDNIDVKSNEQECTSNIQNTSK